MNRHRSAHEATGLRGLRWLAALGYVLLSGCSGEPFSLIGSAPTGLCSAPPPPRNSPPADSYQQAVQRDECLHRFAYALSRSPDDAEDIVGAVIGACRAQVSRSATLLADGDEAAEAWYLERMERLAREKALFRVVQARAGNCT